jgi:hypothetical protein
MKKYLLALSLVTFSFLAFAQQVYIIPRINGIVGKGTQAGKFDALGIGVQYERFRQYDSKLGLLFSLETNLSGAETEKVSLAFAGSNASTDVNYYSTMTKLTAGGIYVPMNGSFASPYISVQGGTMWYRTKLTIEDPEDPSACSPLQTKNVKLSLGLIGNVESGVKIRLRKSQTRPMFLQAGVGYNIGTKASYIKLGDEPNDETTQPYNSKFKMSNGETHDHCIGTMYRTSTSQLVFSIGMSFNLD